MGDGGGRLSGILRCYSDLCLLDGLEDRFEYLRLDGNVGEELFGYARYLNQQFYKSPQWRDVRSQVIIRDGGYDLGVPGWKITGAIYVHHMNPITLEMIRNNDPMMLDPEYLISCSYNTHEAITWGTKELLPKPIVVRRPGDTCPWKQEGGEENGLRMRSDERVYPEGYAGSLQR